jgi:EAL domain-containing protein (putative c-di-GMP-specific phosphodiesterase class I)
MAEETGHVRALTEWVITRAVADQAMLSKSGHSLAVAINISGGLVGDPIFAATALMLLGNATGPIVFEITETAVIDNPKRAIDNMKQWAGAGVEISIDDYGSGLSSLAYLKALPARELKLDRSIVADIAWSSKDALLVKSTISLAHALGLKVTAEGIEEPEAMELLRLFGCDCAQGYFISRPVSLPDLVTFLTSGWSWGAAAAPLQPALAAAAREAS